VKGEMQAKTNYQKSAKGPVAIAECAEDGKFIILDNTGRKDENLDGWKLKRTIDGADKGEYVFADGVTLKAAEKLKVWAKGAKPEGSTDPEYSEATWGAGGHIITRLINPAGEDRATHIKKTTYS